MLPLSEQKVAEAIDPQDREESKSSRSEGDRKNPQSLSPPPRGEIVEESKDIVPRNEEVNIHEVKIASLRQDSETD